MNFKVIAYHLDDRIDLKEIQAKVNYTILKKEHSFVLYKIKDYSLIYLKDYGSVVFFNCDKDTTIDFLKTISGKVKRLDKLPQEDYEVNVDAYKPEKVDFNVVNVTTFSDDIAHLVMLNLAQSVALDNYFNLSFELLEKIKVHSNELENSGRLLLNRIKMRKFIGETMNLKNRIAENLYVFDTSDLAWSTENLSQLDYQMKEELEVVQRHHGLQQNISVIKENLDLFRDLLQHQHSSFLEWIIIILILLEVLPMVFDKLF